MNAGSIVANLKLNINDFKGGIDKAQSQLTDFQKKTKDVSKDLKVVGTAMVTGGTAIAAGLGVSIKTAAGFEQQMSKVKALSGATEKEFAKLRDTAKDLGAKTSFSAAQAGEGMEYLALAGWKTSDIIAAMPGMLDLAAAGSLELSSAADITSDTMQAFQMSADKATHAADVFAFAQANANTNVEQLGEGMKYLAPVANTMGLSLEESSAAMMFLADSGLKGSMAGRSLASSLTRLAKPTKEMQDVMDETGMAFFDAEGNMKSMPEIVAVLEQGMAGMSSEQRASTLSTIMGAEAYKHWAILLEKGSGSLQDMTDNLINADGTAKDMADTMLDNLNGSITILKSGLEGMAITIGEILIPYMEILIGWLQSAVDWFNGLSDEVQEGIVIFTALSSIFLLVGGSFLLLLGFIPQMVAGFKSFLTVVKLAATGAGHFISALTFLATNPIGWVILALTALAAGIYFLVQNFDVIKAKLEEFGFTMENASAIMNQLKDGVQALWAKLGDSGVFEVIGGFLTGIIDKFVALGDGIKTLIETSDFTPLVDAVVAMLPMIFGLLLGGIPKMLFMGYNLLNAVAEGMGITFPELIELITNFIVSMIEKFAEMLPQFIDTGIGILMSLIDGLLAALPSIIEAITGVIETLLGTIVELLPVVIEAGIQILTAVIEGLVATVPTLVGEILGIILVLVNTLIEGLPKILDAGIQILFALIEGIMKILPELLTAIGNIVIAIVGGFIENLPSILNAGIQILLALLKGILQVLPQILGAAFKIVVSLAATLIKNAPQILMAGVQLIWALIKGVFSLMGEVESAIREIGAAMLSVLGNISLVDIGKDLIRGLWNGISNMTSWITGKLEGFGDTVLSGIKGFFGIKSPSRVFRDEIGVMLVRGLNVGMEKMEDLPIDTLANMSKNMVDSFNPELTANAVGIVDTIMDGASALKNVMGGLDFEITAPQIVGLSGNFGTVYPDELPINDGNGSTEYNGPMVNVENMNVSDESDARQVSKELFNLQRSHDRSKGGK